MQEIQPQGTGGQTLKNIKKDWNCGFWKRVSLSVFQSSFLFFVTIDMILGESLIEKWTSKPWHSTFELDLIRLHFLLFSFEKWSVFVKKNYTHRDAMEASNDSCSCSVAFICSSTCLALKTTNGKRQYDDKRRDTHRRFTAVQKHKWWVQYTDKNLLEFLYNNLLPLFYHAY